MMINRPWWDRLAILVFAIPVALARWFQLVPEPLEGISLGSWTIVEIPDGEHLAALVLVPSVAWALPADTHFDPTLFGCSDDL